MIHALDEIVDDDPVFGHIRGPIVPPNIHLTFQKRCLRDLERLLEEYPYTVKYGSYVWQGDQDYERYDTMSASLDIVAKNGLPVSLLFQMALLLAGADDCWFGYGTIGEVGEVISIDDPRFLRAIGHDKKE